METRANYALIGAFTLAVIAGAFAFVYWFSGSDKAANRKTYRMVFTSSVSGLSRGATVLFNGLKVGEVTSIGLAEDPRVVVAIIVVDPRTPIKSDTRARLESTGFTGVAAVALTGGTTGEPPVETGEGGALPTIHAEPSELQNIIDTLQNLSSKVDGLIDRADHLVGDNSQTITNTLNNVEKVTAAFADNADGLKDLIASLADVGKNLAPFVDSLSRNAGSIDEIARNTTEATAKLNASADKIQALVSQPGASSILGDMADAAKSIRKLADNLDQRAREIAAGFNRVTGPGLRSLEALSNDSRHTLDEVNRAVRSLEKNPQQLIFGAKPQVPEYGGK